MSKKKNIWLIGSGKMANEYFKVLKSLKINVKIIGRGIKSAKYFTKINKTIVFSGGIKKNLKLFKPPEQAIITTQEESLCETTCSLIKAGTKRVLLEKPGGINIKELKKIKKLAKKYNSKIFIAYNRRFYNSVLEAKKIIQKDNGILSAQFDFTEYSDIISKLKRAPSVKKHWLLVNSAHVIDLVFYLIGNPKKFYYLNKDSMKWHPSSAIFAGAGITSKKIIFSYHSNWRSQGRWGIELFTKKRKIIFRPLEKIYTIKKNLPEYINFKNNLDKKYKPGLYLQTKSFLENKDQSFCTIDEQINRFKLFYKIANY